MPTGKRRSTDRSVGRNSRPHQPRGLPRALIDWRRQGGAALTRSLRWVPLLAAALVLIGGTALAAGPGDEADLWYQRGDDAFLNGRHQEAAHAFEKSHELLPDPVAAFMAGRAHEAADQLDEAIAWYERFLGYEGTPPERQADARERIERIGGVLTQRRYEALMRQGREADGLGAYGGAAAAFEAAFALTPTAEALWAWARALDAAGERDAAVTRLRELLGRDDTTDEVRLIAAERLDLLVNPPPPAPPPEPEVVTTPPSPWGWVAVAAGAALMGGGVGMHFWAEGLRDEVLAPTQKTASGTIQSVSQRRAAELQDEANTVDSVAVVGIALGSAAVIGGVVVLLTTGGEPVTPEVVAIPVAGGGLVSVGGRF